MSWLFSQALVAEYSGDICSVGEPSAQLNVMPTPQQFWRNGKMMESSKLSRFGLTLQLLTVDRGEELLMSYLAAFLALISAVQDEAKALQEPIAASGKKWQGSFAKYDPYTCLWKTAQYSLLADSGQFLETWPRQGMTLNGDAYLLPNVAPIICEIASGLLPTMRANDAEKRGNFDMTNPRNGLPAAVRLQATLIARDAKAVKGAARSKNALGSEPLIIQIAEQENCKNGRLNPEWCEWFMGWPQHWTSLTESKNSVTAKFQEWRQQHSIY